MDEILVEMYLPASGKTYDIKIPYNAKIYTLTGKTEKKSIAMMQNSNKNTEMRFSYAEQVKRDGIRNITSEITDGLSSGTVSLNESKVTEVLSSVDTDSGTTILSKSEIGIEKITLFKDVLIIHTDKEIV